MALLLSAQKGSLVVEEDISGHDQSPEANNGGSGHELIMVDAKHVFGVLEEDLNLPAHGNMVDQGDQVRLQIAGGPVADGFGWAIQAGADDNDLAAVQLTNARRQDMDKNCFVFSIRPSHFLVSL